MEVDNLPEVRLNRRMSRFLAKTIERRSVVIHKISDSEAEERSYYRLLHNPRLEPGHVVDMLRHDCARQVEQGEHYLVFQDTTQPNFERNRHNIADTSGLGVIGDAKSLGFFLHPSLVVEAKTGRCLGFSHVHYWSRPEAAPDKHERKYQNQPIEEKESYRWICSGLESKQVLDKAAELTIICDREGDISEMFEQLPDEKTHLLVRCCRDRVLHGQEGKLYSFLDNQPVGGEFELKLKADFRKNKTGRKARIVLRWAEVEIKPASLKGRRVKIWALQAREADAPAGQSPVLWRLLTTHQINCFEDAIRLINWYSQRWNIEQIFRLLKHQGLNIEALDLETGKALISMSLLSLYTASKIMLLHISSKVEEPQPIGRSFTQEEVACMEAVNKQMEGHTHRQKNPYQPASLQWVYWIMGRLGGWKPNQNKAGVISLIRGWERFCQIYQGWKLAQTFVS